MDQTLTCCIQMKTIAISLSSFFLFFIFNNTFGQNQSPNAELLEFISKSNHHKVDSVLSKGCDPNFQENSNSPTPAMLAVYGSDLEMLKLLVKYGADFKRSGLLEIKSIGSPKIYTNIVQTGIGEGKIRILEYLADSSKTNIPISEIINISSLKLAIRYGRKNVFNFILDKMPLSFKNYHELFNEALSLEKLGFGFQILPKITFFSNTQILKYANLIIESRQRYFEDDSLKIKLLKGIGVDSSYQFEKKNMTVSLKNYLIRNNI